MNGLRRLSDLEAVAEREKARGSKGPQLSSASRFGA
jgi:hypothetical protein